MSKFSYAELLTIYDGLNKLPKYAVITHRNEKVSVEYLKIKIQLLAEDLISE